jgi:hypothetical protein
LSHSHIKSWNLEHYRLVRIALSLVDPRLLAAIIY